MPFPFQIVQTGNNDILMAYEYRERQPRHQDGQGGTAAVDTWMGQSVGRWEGDTLVVDVTGFNDQTWFDRAGNFHSEALHVVERFTPRSPDVLEYQATIEDPKVFTRPWKIRCRCIGGRKERAAPGVQVCRVRRRADVRAPAQEDRRREAVRRRAPAVAVVSAIPSAAA